MSDPFYVVLPDYSIQRIALITNGTSNSLPQFAREEGIRYHTVATVNATVSTAWHIPVTVSHCLKEGVNGAHAVFLLHNHDESSSLPPNVEWVELSQLNSISFEEPTHQLCVSDWVSSKDDPSWNHVPWSKSTFFGRATKWINEKVAQTGATVLGAPIQIRTWALSCVLRVETNNGTLYFKALPDFFGHEPVLAKYLVEHFPKYFVDVVAIDASQHWMLMKEYAGSEPETYEHWHDILKAMTEIQSHYNGRLDELVSLGCSDRRLERLPELLKPVSDELKQPHMLEFYGVNEEEAEELGRRLHLLPELCRHLESCGIAETLIHGDLWGPNTIVRDTKSDKAPLIFDWTDASVAHPFLDIYISTTSEKNEAKRSAQRQAHIDVWSEYFPREQVVKALEISEQVAPYYFVLAWRNVQLNAPEQSRWELIYLLHRFVRYILNAKQLDSKPA